jgi:lipoprotein signal peptidase
MIKIILESDFSSNSLDLLLLASIFTLLILVYLMIKKAYSKEWQQISFEEKKDFKK